MNFSVPFNKGYANLKVKSLLHIPFGVVLHETQWHVQIYENLGNQNYKEMWSYKRTLKI